ncbi:MAG: 2-oxo acid dehydrogenase subunit E2 [Acidimicrobiia bacterium]|nr:2-oxo acid dehydrogenase subunit E2 [Acidimicrobiia bacterium]
MDVTMPQLGETVTEGTITRWFKQVGEQVEVDQPLFEVSTDKVDSEVPAPASGYLAEIRVAEGETVEVGAVLAVITESASEGAAPAAAPTAPPAEAAPEPAPSPPPTPRTRARAGSCARAGSGAGAHATATRAGAVRALGRRSARSRGHVPGRPAVARRARSGALAGPGHGSRGTDHPSRRAGVRRGPAATSGARAGSPCGPGRPRPPPRRPPPARPVPARGDEVVPFDHIRRRTAEHMVRSKATSAHVYTSVEVDFERVERVRRAHREGFREREGFSLTYLPFVVRAVCDTIDDYPRVNASVEGETLVVHHDVHVGIAVDLDFHGLIAPVIRDADGKRLRLVAREIRDLADRARRKQLSPDEVLGGTFTVTNPGPFGSYMTLPIINQPQVAILSTDGIAKRPVVVEGPDGEDTIAVHHTGLLALTWDHRAFDGAYASSFLRQVKEILEGRDWEAELA